MIYKLTEKIKLMTGEVVDKLTVRESTKVKEVFAAQKSARLSDGTTDFSRFTAELLASLSGLAYEDVLEMDIRDFDALDVKLSEIRYGKTSDPKDSETSTSKPSSESKTSS